MMFQMNDLMDCLGNLKQSSSWALGRIPFLPAPIKQCPISTAFSTCQKATWVVRRVATPQRQREQASQLNPCMPDTMFGYSPPQGLHHSLWICLACVPAVPCFPLMTAHRSTSWQHNRPHMEGARCCYSLHPSGEPNSYE